MVASLPPVTRNHDPGNDIPMPKSPRRKAREKDVILLKDLAPRADVRGGAAKIRFGETARPTALKSDLKPPKR